MKWPSIDESVSLCICLLTVAIFFYWLFVVEGKIFRVRALKLTVLLGSDDLGYGPGSCFNFKPVQTSRCAISDPLPEPSALQQQNTLLSI